MSIGIKQDYSAYTAEDHEVWSILFDRQIKLLPNYASPFYLDGIDKVGFQRDRIPHYETCNERMRKLTGWSIYAVPGLIDNFNFFTLLSEKKFPAAYWIRKREQIDYLEEPDLFHDIFGHIPLLVQPAFSDFLVALANIALKHIDNEWAIELLARLYWYTVEFGLIKDGNELKIYGAGILSSGGETVYYRFAPNQ